MAIDYTFVTPMPPQRTGIADYADGLVSGLKALGRRVRIHTQTRFGSTLGDDGKIPLKDFDKAVSPPERTVYQIGNNSEFHDEIILHLMKNGGVVHLHDFSLHHIFAHFTYSDADVYYGLLCKWYGRNFANIVRARHESSSERLWETREVLKYPLHEEVIARANAVIVHSQFARAFIVNRFPHKAVHVVPQRYPDGTAVRRSTGRPLRVCSLGFVDPYKTVDNKIKAIAECRDRGVEVTLDVVGEINSRCQNLPMLAEDLCVADRVKFLGSVSQQAFIDYFKTYDACVVLREPSVGETSAVVSRGLQYGIPLIVNDVGSYSELPAFVPKLKRGADVATDLADVLVRWSTEPGAYKAVSDSAYEYARNEALFTSATAAYDQILVGTSLA